jgi:hypothetical protein
MSIKALREELSNISGEYAKIYNSDSSIIEEKKKANSRSTDPKADVDGDGKKGTKADKYLADLHARVQKFTQAATNAEQEEEKGRADLTTATAHKTLLDLHKAGFKTDEIENILNTALQNHANAKNLPVPAMESIVNETGGEAEPAAAVSTTPIPSEQEEVHGQLLLPKITSIKTAIKAAFDIHHYIHEHIKDEELAEMIVNEIVSTIQALHQQHKAAPAPATAEV